ncbi:MAG: GntR family transcriptional regulator [Sulfitobacter sp.]
MNTVTQSPKDALSAHLKTSILTLELQPGADLDEAALSETFGLSRTPLREVFRDLAGAGYVELHAGRGARVAELSHTTLRDFFLAAPMVYGAITRLAAQNATPDQIDALRAAQDQFRNALRAGGAAERTLANNRFHEITGEMAGNTYLLPSFRRLLIDHARIGMTFYQPTPDEPPENLTKASAHHDEIIEAIVARNADAAARLADDHWHLSRDQIARFVMPSPLDARLGALPASIARGDR